MTIIKNPAKQMPFYSEILLDTTQLKKCDRALVEKASQLIKNLAKVDPEKAKMVYDALQDCINSLNKTLFRQTMDIVKTLFLSLLGVLVVSMGLMCLSIALLFFIPLLAFAPPMALACIGIAIAGLALLGIGLYPLDTVITLSEKNFNPTGALKKITAELNPDYDEAKKELDFKQDKKIVLKESNSVENKSQSAFPCFFKPSRDNVDNKDNTATYRNNMILATQLRK